MEEAIVKRDVNSTVVRAMASTATMFRVRAAAMDRMPRWRTHLPLDTFIMALTPAPQCGRLQCG